MAEPLKNSFGPEVVVRIATMIESVYPEFDRDAYLAVALENYAALELTPRARQVAEALSATLPKDRARAIEIVTASLPSASDGGAPTGLESFIYLPFVFFVANEGLGCFETSMKAQHELTKCFTAEFSIRAYIERHPEATMERLTQWARDSNHHVRRLVSEGTRPRLPWAARLVGFQKDPSPVLELLEILKDDSEEYVRRSVANNLNDVSKDHPALVVAVAERWWRDGSKNRKRLIRHALRTLVKAGDAGALEVLGYGADSPVEIRRVNIDPIHVQIGGKIRITVEVFNPTDTEARALVDLRIHFVKRNGTTSPKVFKGKELALAAEEAATIRKTISLAQHSTRKHYAGIHRVEVLINGATHVGGTFHLA